MQGELVFANYCIVFEVYQIEKLLESHSAIKRSGLKRQNDPQFHLRLEYKGQIGDQNKELSAHYAQRFEGNEEVAHWFCFEAKRVVACGSECFGKN